MELDPIARSFRARSADIVQSAVAVAFATLGIVLARDEIVALYAQDKITFSFSVAAAISAVVWMFGYYQAVKSETDDLALAFGNVPLRGIKMPSFAVGVMFGISFGAMIATVFYPIFFFALVVLVQVFDIYGVSIINGNVAELTRRALRRDRDFTDPVSIVYEYYIIRPHLVRCSYLLVVYNACLVLALAAHQLDEKMLLWAAFALFVLTFWVGRHVIERWRTARDEAISEYHARQTESVEQEVASGST